MFVFASTFLVCIQQLVYICILTMALIILFKLLSAKYKTNFLKIQMRRCAFKDFAMANGQIYSPNTFDEG